MAHRRNCIAGLALLALLAGACRTAPIYNVTSASLSSSEATLEEVGKQIERAARFQNWETESPQPGILIVTRRRGKHVGVATIRYDTGSFSIALRNSHNLKQANGQIHKLYNQWVRALEQTIRREVAAGY